MATKTYEGADFEVLWQPSVSIHSKNYWRDSQEVFNPFRRPWITLENGGKKEIKQNVLCCLCGALQWFENTTSTTNSANINEVMLYAEVRQNGPLLVKGEFMPVHADGKREFKEKITAFCRCSSSANKPYCDGVHKTIEFKG